MTRFDRYLLGEALSPLLFSLLLYSTLAVVSVTLPRLQWIVGAPLGPLSLWLLLQFPAALVQTFPVALVLTVLLVFGQLTASNEVLAAQAGGVSLLRIGAIFIALSTVFTATAVALNEFVLPVTNAKVGSLYWPLTTGGENGLWRLAARNIPLDGYSLYFEKTEGDDLRGVRIEAWEDDQLSVLFADRAVFTDEGLELYDYRSSTLDFAALETETASPEAFLKKFLVRLNRPDSAEQKLVLTTSSTVDDLVTRFSEGGFEDTRSLKRVYQDASNVALPPQSRRQAEVLFHRKLAEPFANLTLLLVAIPLSLLYARSRSVAFGLSLVITLLWYLLLTVGQLLAQSGATPVWLGVWLGNLVLAGVGLYLLLARTRLR